MTLKMEFEEKEIEQRIEDIVNYYKFIKEKETTEFVNKWNDKGYKKAGVIALLLKLWLFSNQKKNSKSILKDAEEILGKLTGEKEWYSFLSNLKLTPEKKP
ncbi:MAG: hypothetical protein AB1391_00025 [Candidatus Micrarchaeota archaeon]